ncbi:TauD/TfdA family dioxygenase [Amycolatopsis anabasis]|uniref:TauD/TfdA family dioxygenase n=1 Tax=Amycolatopsis anabasis TaxID=1840409 RepID=UPI001C551558|nr:TauD/TfdA family dioxygenase [Amycolatopsis anabasis]
MERIVLTETESAEIASLAEEVLTSLEDWDPLRFVDEATTIAARLPLRLRQFLVNARGAEADVIVVSGLPVDPDLVPTPTGWDMAAKTGAGRREELVLLLCGSVLGDPFCWATQQDGRVVHDVCPAPGMEESLTSASSKAALSLHTEDVHHPCRGDYVSLFCLRNPDAVGTTIVRIGALDLPEDTREVLAQDRFRFYPDDSHTGAVLNDLVNSDRLAGREFHAGPVLFGPKERPYLRFDIDFMSGVDGTADEAIRVAQERIGAAVERVVLEPGDAVFVDNYRVVHGREPFSPRYDGKDRWLKRLNLIRDIRRLYAMSDVRSRVIA